MDRSLKTRDVPDRGEFVKTQVRYEARAVFRQNRHWAGDDSSVALLRMGSLLLAVYRVVLPLVGNKDAAIKLLRTAVAASGKNLVHPTLFLLFGISPFAPRKAFEKIAANLKKRIERVFGSHFLVEQVVNDGERSFIHVKRCFFYDFFAANGVPELTRVFCAWDNLWADELKKPKYEVGFDRPTTLGYGGDVCRFHLRKTGQ